jgi:predicted RNA binding protein YcfA (HicA-like mRNA interferase family)
LPKLVPLNGHEVLQAPKNAGFLLDAVEGSHHIMRHPVTGQRASVPVHGGRDLKTGTLRGIVRDAGLTVEEFLKLRK